MLFMNAFGWTFLSNHTHVLICLFRDPTLRARDLAQQVGITERAVMRIIAELAESGYLEIEKVGRRNHYHICADKPLRHPVEAQHSLQHVLEALA